MNNGLRSAQSLGYFKFWQKYGFSQGYKIIFEKKFYFYQVSALKIWNAKKIVRSDVYITIFSKLFEKITQKKTEILQIYEFFFSQNSTFLSFCKQTVNKISNAVKIKIMPYMVSDIYNLHGIRRFSRSKKTFEILCF
jgi:hypothetical protein